MATKTHEEIEELKQQWVSDPCWDIEETEGFESHRDELKRFSLDMEARWSRTISIRPHLATRILTRLISSQHDPRKIAAVWNILVGGCELTNDNMVDVDVHKLIESGVLTTVLNMIDVHEDED
jgi:hypothetical protein